MASDWLIGGGLVDWVFLGHPINQPITSLRPLLRVVAAQLCLEQGIASTFHLLTGNHQSGDRQRFFNEQRGRVQAILQLIFVVFQFADVCRLVLDGFQLVFDSFQLVLEVFRWFWHFAGLFWPTNNVFGYTNILSMAAAPNETTCDPSICF